MYLCPEHTHTLHVGVLALHVGLTHEYLTVNVHKRTDSSSSHAVLSGSCLGYNACLSQLLCQEHLTDTIVYLVRAGMVKVLALQIELTAVLLAHALCIVQWRWTTHIILQQGIVFILEFLAFDDRLVGFLQVMNNLI